MIAAFLIAGAAIPSTPDLGKAEGQCRANENGPAFLVEVLGLKDRAGRLKLELYPANDEDFLADDNILVGAGKTFRRVEEATPASGPVQLCIRAPGPGTYALSLMHDRDSNRRFSLSIDGIGFPGNPKLGWSKPHAAAAKATVGSGPTRIAIKMNYRRGLFSFGPLEK
ncbi:DUF2141 domain-containing protein [Sphingobium sp. EM0848]|uniref:DUF2141 domain-containing protein n=1 Tax=Sphingobium sp. EM0848 TaxID=2743473 RepID=UPI00159C76DF|nr:DUF2141 domain-containing protein [Sphingobium sp. EM0848]